MGVGAAVIVGVAVGARGVGVAGVQRVGAAVGLGAVVEAVTVGVGVVGVGAVGLFFGVGAAVLVGVAVGARGVGVARVERIGAAVGLGAVIEAVAVGVGVVGVGAVGLFFGVGAAVVVGVAVGARGVGVTGVEGVGAVGDLVVVVEPVTVGVHRRQDVVAGVVGVALAEVDAAVVVGVLDAVRHRAIVGVRVGGIGGGLRVEVGHEDGGIGVWVRLADAALGAVEQAVVVGVGVERVGLVGGAVEQAVVVGVRVVGISAQVGLVVVGEAVAVGVDRGADVVGRIVGIALIGVDGAVVVGVLHAVGDAAAVGVGHQRIGGALGVRVGHKHGGIGVGRAYFEAALGAIEDAIAVGVGVEGVGLPRASHAVSAQLVPVAQAVVVGVGVEGVGVLAGVVDAVGAGLDAVGDAVAVGVGVARIGARGRFLGVGEAVLVGVAGGAVGVGIAGVERVRVALDLVAVVEAVSVGVRVAGIGARGFFLGVGEAVLVGVAGGAVIVGITRVERVRAALDLSAVVEAVGVGVRVAGVGAAVGLVGVGEAVLVGVAGGAVGVGITRVERVGAALDLSAVVEAVGVGVWVAGVGAAVGLVGVGEAVLIGVAGGAVGVGIAGVEGVGAALDLSAVVEAVGVGVWVAGIGAAIDLVDVGEAVAVSVAARGAVIGVTGVEGIGATGDLDPIEEAIVVGVGVVGIGADDRLFGVGEAVAVRITLGEAGIGITAVVGIALAGDLVDGGRAILIVVHVLEVRQRVAVGVAHDVVDFARLGAGLDDVGQTVCATAAFYAAQDLVGIVAGLLSVEEPIAVRVEIDPIGQAVAVGVGGTARAEHGAVDEVAHRGAARGEHRLEGEAGHHLALGHHIDARDALPRLAGGHLTHHHGGVGGADAHGHAVFTVAATVPDGPVDGGAGHGGDVLVERGGRVGVDLCELVARWRRHAVEAAGPQLDLAIVSGGGPAGYLGLVEELEAVDLRLFEAAVDHYGERTLHGVGQAIAVIIEIIDVEHAVLIEVAEAGGGRRITRVEGISAGRHLGAVGEAVVVGVWISRIGTGGQLGGIVEAIAVRVRVGIGRRLTAQQDQVGGAQLEGTRAGGQLSACEVHRDGARVAGGPRQEPQGAVGPDAVRREAREGQREIEEGVAVAVDSRAGVDGAHVGVEHHRLDVQVELGDIRGIAHQGGVGVLGKYEGVGDAVHHQGIFEVAQIIIGVEQYAPAVGP